MIKIHCYEDSRYFPEFPANSYCSENVEDAVSTLSDLLSNNISGISKILIEDDKFGVHDNIVKNQSLITNKEE